MEIHRKEGKIVVLDAPKANGDINDRLQFVANIMPNNPDISTNFLCKSHEIGCVFSWLKNNINMDWKLYMQRGNISYQEGKSPHFSHTKARHFRCSLMQIMIAYFQAKKLLEGTVVGYHFSPRSQSNITVVKV
jgi:hypothetical protein